jgi:hypothetical protein
MTKEQFDEMIMPLWLIDNDKHRVFLMEAIFQNFKKWQENNTDPVLYGIYTPENELMFVHKTEESAKQHCEKYVGRFDDGFYVDEIKLLD